MKTTKWALLSLAIASSLAHAQRAPVRVHPARCQGQTIEVTVRVSGDVNANQLEARRLSSRERAEEQARVQLHRFVDAHLATHRTSAPATARAHAWVDEHLRRIASRPLVDGGVVARYRLSLSTAPNIGLAWCSE